MTTSPTAARIARQAATAARIAARAAAPEVREMTPIPQVTTEPYLSGRTSKDAVVRGDFKHNRGPFSVWVNADGTAQLSACAVVIQAAHYGSMGQPGPLPTVYVGSFIDVDGKVYRIEDNRRGYDPTLVLQK